MLISRLHFVFSLWCWEYGHLGAYCPKGSSASRSLNSKDWLNDESPSFEDEFSFCDSITLSREHEYSQRHCGSVSVKGRINLRSGFWWTCLNCSNFVINIISEGYQLPFSCFPEPVHLRNNKSAQAHPKFVEEAITQLLQNGCVRELKQPPTCVNPLTVAIGKKLRLVIDLRHVNACLVKPKFRYEDLRSLSKVFQRGFWFVTWDLKSGYHHVDIYEPHQTYLGFAWPYLGTQRYFAFTVLPFGLSTTCNCFIKLLRPLLHRWRLLNFNCFLYLDDGISGHPDKVSASGASERLG